MEFQRLAVDLYTHDNSCETASVGPRLLDPSPFSSIFMVQLPADKKHPRGVAVMGKTGVVLVLLLVLSGPAAGRDIFVSNTGGDDRSTG